MTPAELEAYDALCAYTLTHGNIAFTHQHVVDAGAAWRATPASKPIGIAFALVGLYLRVEKGFTGRQVQRIHMQLAQRKQQWPTFPLPATRGMFGPLDVMGKPEGVERDQAIDAWCASLWQAYAGSRNAVIQMLRENGIDA